MSGDTAHMRRALRLAGRARGRTAPNPMVGAVVVSGGRVVGEGWHPKAGEPHAEVFALRRAGEAARGATLYVTLEPCCHHGRTPPCTEAILAAGIRRVVAAMDDPFPRVSGRGFACLRAAGVDVETGVLEEEARDLNRAFTKAVRTGLPWLTLKMATTLDGKIATRTGDSRWVTCEAARRCVHRLRDWNDAVMIGIGTARADDPHLTTRIRGGRTPLRVVVDPRADLSPESYLARTARDSPVLCAAGMEAETAALEALGVRIERIPSQPSTFNPQPSTFNPQPSTFNAPSTTHLDLRLLLRRLVHRGIHSVLCEGGAGLAGSLLDAGLVDEVAWFIAPKLVGQGPGAVGGWGVERMAEALSLEQIQVRRFGTDVGVFGRVAGP